MAKVIIILFLFTLLASCVSSTSTTVVTLTNVIETPAALPTSTLPVELQMLLTAPTDISNPTAVPSPAPDQQVYTDPHGWYSVFFLRTWTRQTSPMSFQDRAISSRQATS